MSLSYNTWFKNGWINALIIVLAGLLLRLPLYHTPFWRTNDTMEYINVARNINDARGLTQSIKFHLYDPAPVVVSALRSRPPLTSIIYAGLLRIHNDPYFLQIFNLLLGILNALIIYAITKNLTAGLLATSNPNILITGRMVLSDQLFATFALLAAWVFFQTRDGLIKSGLSGILIALLTLTRLEGLWLLPIMVIASRKKIAAAVVIVGSFLLIMSPYFWLNYKINDSPLFSKNDVHYRLFDVREALEDGFEKSLPAATTFIRENWLVISPKILYTTGYHFASLIEFAYLGPISVLLFFYLAKKWRGYWPWLAFCAGVMLLYGSLWSATFERSRHFIFAYLLLLIPTADFLKYHRGKIVSLILLATMAGYLLLDTRRILWARNVDPTISVWDHANKTEIYSWIRDNIKRGDIIASTNPFMINLQTGRPSIAIPTNLTSENISRYLNKYAVNYVLIINEDRLDRLFANFEAKANLASGRIYLVDLRD